MESSASAEVPKKKKFTKDQWLTLFSLALGNLGLAICSALQAPFFPMEAEKKLATPSQYGLVFGLFYLTNFIFAPIFGKMMSTVGPDFLRDVGIFVIGVCFIIFGYLDRSPPGATFLALAYIVRIVEGIGSAAYKTSNFAIVAAALPQHTAIGVAVLETMFGLGLIIGPTVGGALYEVGGYQLPFVSFGAIMIVIAFLTMCILPKTEMNDGIGKKKASTGMLQYLKNPLILLYSFQLALASICLGFNNATLEPRLRAYDLTPLGVGIVFVIGGGLYAVTSPIWGILVDKKVNAKVLTITTCILMGTCYLLLGPAPIFNFEGPLWLVIICLVIFGAGFGGSRVIACVDCLNNVLSKGHDNDMGTFGAISGLCTAAFQIGLFIGPTAGGFMVENLGYSISTMIISVLSFFQGLLFFVYLLWEKGCMSRLRWRRKSRLDVSMHTAVEGVLWHGSDSPGTTPPSLTDSLGQSSEEIVMPKNIDSD